MKISIFSDMPFSHRPRSNTAQRLEKMDREKKQASKVKHVKWEPSNEEISDRDFQEMFQRKEFRKKDPASKKSSSMLTEQLEQCPDLPHNPFMEYAKFDGSVSEANNIFCLHFYQSFNFFPGPSRNSSEEVQNFHVHVTSRATNVSHPSFSHRVR